MGKKGAETEISQSARAERAGARSFRHGRLSRNSGNAVHRLSSQYMSSPNRFAAEASYAFELRWICQELGFDTEYANTIGTRLLGLKDADRGVPYLSRKPLTHEEISDFLVRAFIKFTDHADLILILLDNVQWIDSISRTVICRLASMKKNLLMICSLLSDKAMRQTRWIYNTWYMADSPRYREISLGPFSLPEARQLMSKSFGHNIESFKDSFVNDIYEKTGGLPVFLVEFLENIKRNNKVEIREGKVCWQSSNEVSQVSSLNLSMYISFLACDES